MEQYAEELLGLVADKLDIMLAELADHFQRVRGERLSQSVIWRCLDRLGMTFKKTAHASEQSRPDVAAKYETWRTEHPNLDPERLIFIDETEASIKMARRYGPSPRGERCVAPASHGH